VNYTADYTDEVAKEFLNIASQPQTNISRYSIDLGVKDFNNVRILDASRYVGLRLNGREDLELEDNIVHQAILGIKITIKLDGQNVGSFIINELNADWDSIPVFRDHPLGFTILKEIVLWNLIKKWLPPLKADPVAADQKL
jgi:hypothetical protein